MVFEQWDERGKLNCIIRKWELFDAKDLTIAAYKIGRASCRERV